MVDYPIIEFAVCQLEITMITIGLMQFYAIFNTKWLVNDNLPKDNTIMDIGNLLLGKYLLPFEVVSILLLAALIGAAMLSRKKVE